MGRTGIMKTVAAPILVFYKVHGHDNTNANNKNKKSIF